MDSHVFHDPSGRRARRADLAMAVLAAAVLLIFGLFAMSLALAPQIPKVTLTDPRMLTALRNVSHGSHAQRADWAKIPRPKRAPSGGPGRPITVGFYVSWDPVSVESLREHVGQIDVVAPQWLTLHGGAGQLDVVNDPQAEAIMRKGGHPPAVIPIIHNYIADHWDKASVDELLVSPRARHALIANLEELADKRGFAGYMFDLEDMSESALAAYPAFIAEINSALKQSGREVWVTAPFDEEGWPLRKLQNAASTLVLMAYDDHFQSDKPGSVAGQEWFERNLARTFPQLDQSRLILALGAFGYDWGPDGLADAVTFHESTVNALDSGVAVNFDPATLNPNFDYADGEGHAHHVWFLDAATTFNEVKVADAWRPRGYGLWRLGQEDPGVWSLLGKAYGSASTAGLIDIPPSEDVDFDGNGEILHVSETPKPGKRTLNIDAQSGIITHEAYDQIPSAYVVQRLGQTPKLAALTFDDGPDPRWTPKILDILKAKHAPATFFVIGSNMEEWPDLVQRELREGHVVGSHTYTHPNIAELSPTEIDLELNLTQRLFQVLTDRTLRFFRPPYLGDADPSTTHEMRPVMQAQDRGYITVGLRNDPDDWKKPDAALIVQRAVARLNEIRPEASGQIILLHDSGGDRSRTIQALPQLIDAIRADGFQLVTVAQLAGLSSAQANPRATTEPGQLMLDRAAFDMVRGFNKTVAALFLAAIALGLARLAFLSTLSLIHFARTERRTPPELDPAREPIVSVLIPCFNEESVIVTSIERILASEWSHLEVIVLDDGSKDATAARVTEHFGANERVRLMSFENGGKAAALNRGLAAASGDIVVALDADTQFPPETIGMLARWFGDEKIGAVAGNALVGNRVSIITRWQSLEYVTAQNLERRALAALGAVTVVPGAVGAWRRRALAELGGVPQDTLAEDQDLTIAVQRAGWKVEFDPDARAYTEAPETLSALLKQRFRWSFGTLQCVWKHRKALFSPKHPTLGFVALPQIWLFQIVLALVQPLVDLVVVFSLLGALFARLMHPNQWDSVGLERTLLYWAAFVLVDLAAAALGMALERRAPWKDVAWIPIQRFGYRQLMYYVVVQAVLAAVRGPRVGWGKLARTARVTIDRQKPLRDAA